MQHRELKANHEAQAEGRELSARGAFINTERIAIHVVDNVANLRAGSAAGPSVSLHHSNSSGESHFTERPGTKVGLNRAFRTIFSTSRKCEYNVRGEV